jgi:hypothetical protein
LEKKNAVVVRLEGKKKSYLDDIVIGNQNVSGGQISVNIVLRFQIGHSCRDVGRHVYQLRQFQIAAFTCGKNPDRTEYKQLIILT